MTTPTTTALPVTLGRDTVLHLAADQSIAAVDVARGAWSHMADVAAFGDGRILSVFHYEATWDYWERHPVGTELVHVLTGSVVFHLDAAGATRAVPVDAGQSLLVPAGAWHRAEVAVPVSILFVTPTPALTEHRAVGAGRGAG